MSWVRMICFLVGAIAALLSFSCEQGYAWEFEMESGFSTTYEYYCQQGHDGFFGKYNIDRSAGVGGLAPGDYSSLNSWVGGQVEFLSSGTDAVRQYFNLDILPFFKLNRAIRFRAKYRLGDYGDPDASDYVANTRPGTDVATSDGQWTMWWLTAQTPWGIIALGKRPMPFGTGLQYNGEGNVTTEGVALISNYGPLRLSYSFRPYWKEPPNPRAGWEEFPYYNMYDKSGIRRMANRVFLTYRQGMIDSGVIYAWVKWHAGPESQARQEEREAFVPYDEDFRHGSAYVKFSNGRFFLNSELAYLERITKRHGAHPLYFESWRYMTELGVCTGPAKLSFLYTFMPGPDRRYGIRIDRQPFHQMAPFGTHDLHRPYSYLLGYAYGAGVDAYDLNGNGYINDAAVLAARLDYAAASNLNLFASFLTAQRTSHGYGWGFMRPIQEGRVTRSLNGTGVAEDEISWTPAIRYRPIGGANPAPSIPDRDLGWEIQAGFDWNLLQQYLFHFLIAYWQPGKWFNYACIDRGVPNWDVPGPGNNWGVNPGRSIDGVVGVEVYLLAEF
ncbi:MAG: hypothetical protein P8182_15180 [Deltaproteobacteria bacterium]